MNIELKNICNLMNDSLTHRFYAFSDENSKGMSDEAIREGFFNILGEDKLTWRGWRNHKNEIFTIMEDVLNVNLPLALENTPFYDNFVEVKNGALGDRNRFTAEDGTVLIASEFSGGHWNTDRRKLSGRKTFALDTSWLYVHVYDDLDRFLKGITTLETMISKMQDALRAAVRDRIYTAFTAALTSLPARFVKSGTYDRLAMTELIQRVQTAAQRNVILAGTKVALASIAEGMEAKWISESQKEEMARSGAVMSLTGLGVTAVEIPQSFARGTYDFKLDDNAVLVLPDNDRFIKVFFEGDTRARDLAPDDTADQTIDTQIQTKVGVGCIFSNIIGKYNIV